MTRTSSDKFDAAMKAYNDDRLDDAMRLMEECAREDDPVACFTMAVWHRETENSEALRRSAYWLKRLEQLAEEGNPQAQWELGQNLRFGNLLPYSVGQANYWLMRAAEGGNPDAQHHLAWFFETGQYDFPVDKAEASSWYERAFEQDHPETIYLYATRLFQDGQPTEAAIELLRKAAEKGLMAAADALRQYTH
jgi:TPR repeat protein